MDMAAFVEECRSCDVNDKEKVIELLGLAAQLGESILSMREKQDKAPPYETILKMYNRICVSLPKARQLSPERKRHIKSCFSQKFTCQDFEKAFHIMQDTPFLRGENERGWRPSFDWIIRSANLLKVLEQRYGAPSAPAGSSPSFDIGLFMDKAKSTPKL